MVTKDSRTDVGPLRSSSDFPRYDGPENWKSDQTVAKITVEADREDITWISGRINEDVDRGRHF